PVRGGRLADSDGTRRIWRAGHAAGRGHRGHRVYPLGEPQLRNVPGAHFRCEHVLAENIIHLVLAKISGAPDNVKGISLFVVPKVLVNEDGSLGERNTLSCGALEKKMGIHGNATCVMNYDGAKGWLVGEAEKGLAAMFIMMNAARLGVGLQGLAQ